jgi:predicted NBD/HSP70 family sugar kinase
MPTAEPQTEQHTPRLSKLGIFQQLIANGPRSRSELAESLNLTRSALTALCRELIEEGLIHEAEVQRNEQRQGRPSILLALNPGYGYFLGVCITDRPPVLTLCDVNGNLLDNHQIASTSEPEAVAAAIGEGIDYFLASQRISRNQLLGTGIALSGLVDREAGVCRLSNELGWSDVPIAKIARRTTGIPAFLENDANAAATGEKLFGNARTGKDFTVVTVDRAIGAAHYIGGELYRGHSGVAGEIGHITLDLNGLPCPCGKRGCLDTIAGSNAILAAARRKQLAAENIAGIEALAAAGDTDAEEILYRAGQALGLTVAHLIQCNNPRTVIFALSEDIKSGVFISATSQMIQSNILPRLVPLTEILIHHMDKNFWSRAAASIAAHEHFRYQASI